MLSFPRDLGYSRNDHISFANAPVTWALASFWTCVLSHLSQSNPRGREEMVCKSHVQPRLRVGSALLLSGSGLVPESQQRGAGALAGSASSPRLGFPEILPSCLSLSCCSEPGLCPVAVGSPPSANPPPHTSHEEAVQGRCSELSATSPRDPPRAPTSGSPGRRTSREGPEGARFSSAPCTRSVLHGLFNPLKC